MDECGLKEIKMIGYPYIWERSRGNRNFVEEKLDRALATTDWLRAFENAYVEIEEALTSDLLEFSFIVNEIKCLNGYAIKGLNTI